jgi:hypothetical protein
MPDHRTPGRALAKDAVHAAIARTGIDQAQQPDETTEPLPVQPLDLLNRLVEDTAHVSQKFTDRATRNVQALIDLTEVSISGWQQAVSELSQQMQQAIADQTQMFNAAVQMCRPEQVLDMHSDFVTARL